MGKHHPLVLNSCTLEHTTAAVTTSADGRVLPTFVIFLQQFPEDGFMDGIDPKWTTAVSESGHMNGELMELWLTKCFIPNIPRDRPVALFVDNHASHVTTGVINICKENNIELFAYPSNATHILQPNDQLFHNLKDTFSELATSLQFLDENLIVNKKRFTQTLYYAIKKSMTKKNIVAAWSKTGNWPVNKQAATVSEYWASHKTATEGNDHIIQINNDNYT